MTSLKTSIKTITYLSDIGCLEIQGASLLFHYYLSFRIDEIYELNEKSIHSSYQTQCMCCTLSQERWRPNLNEVQKKQQRTKPWLLQYNSYACRISKKTYSANLKL